MHIFEEYASIAAPRYEIKIKVCYGTPLP